MADLFRPPVIFRPFKRKQNRPNDPVNLLVTTLAVVAAAPFKPQVLDVRLQRKPRADTFLPPNILLTTLDGKTPPFKAIEITRSERRKSRATFDVFPNTLTNVLSGPVVDPFITEEIFEGVGRRKFVSTFDPPNVLA